VRRYSHSEEEFQAKMCSLQPLVIGEIAIGFTAIRGELVGIARMPQHMIGAKATEAVVEGVKLALRRGVQVIGLGALTSPATASGLTLLRHLPKKVTLTNGNAYTAAVIQRNVVEANDMLALRQKACVAVVGCTGSVGTPATYLLAEAGFSLILVGRNAKRVRHEFGILAGRAVFTDDLNTVHNADIVVMLTNDASARLAPKHVRAGSIVIDCAQPASVAVSAYEEFRSKRVTVVEGGIVRIPGYACTFDFGLPSPVDTFACLAETYLFAKEGIREHSVGRPLPELARRLERIAQRHGIFPRSLNLAHTNP
jgi:fatty aldehyde-generating acyl-ACP reductase